MVITTTLSTTTSTVPWSGLRRGQKQPAKGHTEFVSNLAQIFSRSSLRPFEIRCSVSLDTYYLEELVGWQPDGRRPGEEPAVGGGDDAAEAEGGVDLGVDLAGKTSRRICFIFSKKRFQLYLGPKFTSFFAILYPSGSGSSTLFSSSHGRPGWGRPTFLLSSWCLLNKQEMYRYVLCKQEHTLFN